MAIDMEIVAGTEEYEELQRYFESRKSDYLSSMEFGLDRIKSSIWNFM